MELLPTRGYSLWENSNLSWGPVTEPFVVVHFEILTPTRCQYFFFFPRAMILKAFVVYVPSVSLCPLQQRCVLLQRVAQKSVDTRCLIFCLYCQVNFAPLCTSHITAVNATEGELT